jgi:uncharacterized protein YbjT (DUF2867 family)
MKIVVIGGSGRIGEKLVYNLRQDDQRVLEASPTFGVDTVSGIGLSEALEGAKIVVDVSNSRSLEGADALRFFEASGRNLMAAGRAAGVQHHIALSIVGVDGLVGGDYFRAKKIQEDLIKASGIPFTIVRSTQFFEFIAGVVQDGGRDDIEVSPAFVQPIAGEDLAQALADAVVEVGEDRTYEVAGPERFRLADLASEVATAYEDTRRIVANPHAPYFGVELHERSLLPGPNARIATLKFEDWLRATLQPDRREQVTSAL